MRPIFGKEFGGFRLKTTSPWHKQMLVAVAVRTEHGSKEAARSISSALEQGAASLDKTIGESVRR